MRCKAIAGVVVALVLAPCLSGCGEPSPEARRVQEKAGETWDAMKTWGVDKKAELVRSSSQNLDDLKRKLDDAKRSAPAVEANQKLDDAWKTVQEKFEAMKAASGEQWAKARDEFSQAYEALKQRLANPPAR